MAFSIGKSEMQPEDDDAEMTASEEADVAEEAPEESASFERGPTLRASYPGAADHEGPGPTPGGDSFFVSVTNEGAEELHRFDDPAKAQAFLEGLLAEGVPQEHVTAFSGQRLALHVSHRPVVKLLDGGED